MMKLKTPTEEQKKLIKANNLNTEHWLVLEDNPKELILISIWRRSRRTIKKEVNV